MKISVAKMVDQGIKVWGERGEEGVRPERTKKKTNHRNPFKFRASEIGYCMARLSFDWKEKSEEHSTTALHRMFAGEVWGQKLADLISEGRDSTEILKVENEVSLEKNVKVGKRTVVTVDGHCDIVLTLKNKKKIPVEIKSMGQRSFEGLQRDGEIYDAHDSQLRTYMALLGTTEGILLARRMDGPMEEFTIQHDEAEWQEILDRCVEVGTARQNGKIARREYQPGEPPCTYCPHEKKCWGTEYSKAEGSGKKKPLELPMRGDLSKLYELSSRRKAIEEEGEDLKGKFRRLAEVVHQENNADVIDAVDRDGVKHRLHKIFVCRKKQVVPEAILASLKQEGKLEETTTEYSYSQMRV